MATLVLSAAGSAVGSAVGGTVLGVSSQALGQAVGATLGGVIDQRILGEGSATVESGRARSLRLQASTEGAAIPQLYGRMRLSGQVIWSSRYLERVRTTTQGGKATGGGQTVREFSYSISFAVGLCEGPIRRIGRVWADGQLLDLAGVTHRVYLGDETQLPDAKILAVDGEAPAYRGLAYVVFEDLPLEQFGNRIPQLNFEVFRDVPRHEDDSSPERGQKLPELIQAVALSPGSGEWSLDPDAAQYVFPQGGNQYANVNNAAGLADIAVALDDLAAELPAAKAVLMVVSWFGSDLRVGQCEMRPKIEEAGRSSRPEAWQVAGLTTSTAEVVSQQDGIAGRPNFGGTPSDGSVIRAIRDMAERGVAVTFYPFLLMDIPAGNGLPDPYGGAEQGAFPWRGRITSTADLTPQAASDVAVFFGTGRAE
ncbi:MAG: host specificity protein, partial [Pseudomonadota bacterium]